MLLRGFARCRLLRLPRSCANHTKPDIKNGPGLKEFLIAGKNLPAPNKLNNSCDNTSNVPYINPLDLHGNNRKVFFEVYGCQMNVNDTEVVWSILKDSGYQKSATVKDADIVLVITCAVREGAETKIWNRLKHLAAMKKNRSTRKGPFQIGVLGCMAERLKTELLEKEQYVDIVAGPDSYKDLPRLLSITKSSNQSAVNVLLSLEETYADIIPVRLNRDATTAFVSIMRGCDNMCSYCIVPFTRGKERSRNIDSILNEVKILENQGIKEITLLGQNVNSYRDTNSDGNREISTNLVKGFRTVYKDKKGGVRFAELLERVATTIPNTRIRFTSPHPKDFPDDVLEVIRLYPNICKSIHLPAQSGSSTVLERMRRGYTRQAYIELVEHIRTLIPHVTLSSDFICGFCGETDEEFTDTVTLIERIKYNVAYLFAYSMREKTTAHRRYQDDVPSDVKNKRLQQMIAAFRLGAADIQSRFVGTTDLILIEGKSKRSQFELYGRNDGNIKVIVPETLSNGDKIEIGDFIATEIYESNSQGLKGRPIKRTSIRQFYS